MKIIFISNFYNHHQKEFSDELYRLTEGNYRFFATKKMPQERKKLGWEISVPEYVEEVGDKLTAEKQKEVDEADVVLLGGEPYAFVKNRIRQGKLTFLFTERLFKRKVDILRRIKAFVRRSRWKKEGLYMLCAGGYVSSDFESIGCFQNKAFQWGYFPPLHAVDDVEVLWKNKEAGSLMFCGRLIDWKHPEAVLAVAKRLKAEGYRFRFEMFGDGELREWLAKKIGEEGLKNHLFLRGVLSFEEVRKKMEKTQILLIPSDRQEGWGAVLNEGMNAGMAVVASHEIGATPYLLKEQENGLVFESGNVEDLYQKVKWLLDNPKDCARLGKKAYEKIVKEWNGKEAATRLIALSKGLTAGKDTPYEEGLCSKAPLIKENWYSAKRRKV